MRSANFLTSCKKPSEAASVMILIANVYFWWLLKWLVDLELCWHTVQGSNDTGIISGMV